MRRKAAKGIEALEKGHRALDMSVKSFSSSEWQKQSKRLVYAYHFSFLML
jgi:hypothetical protein